MRELLAFGLILLVAANTVNSGAIYRRYRELEFPAGAADIEALPAAENDVSDLRKDQQIPVQVVEVVEPAVLIAKPIENLRSVEPSSIAIAEAEPAALITNEIIPEKSLDKLEEDIESVRAIEQVVAKEQELPQTVVEAVVEAIVQEEEQKLRNLEPELPAAPAIVLLEETAELEKKDDMPIAEIAEKKLLPEVLPIVLPEALPEILPKEPLMLAMIDDKKASEEPLPIEAELPQLKALKEDEPILDVLPEVQVVKDIVLPLVIETPSELKSLEENIAPLEVLPEVKALKEEILLIESPKEEQILDNRREEELLEKKSEEKKEELKELKQLKELKEEKTEVLKEAMEDAIKEEIKEELKEKIDAEIQELPREAEDLAPMGKQADTADPGATTARPVQPGFIQQLVQNTPLGQLFNTFNGNNQAASEENTPAATAQTIIQALQNTTSQITNSIQQGLQQQLQSLQTTFSGQQPQQAAVAGDAAAPSTARPQGPFQSIVTSFLGNGNQPQPPAGGATQQQSTGPLQGILNLFGGNRVPNAGAAPAAVSSTPAAESLPATAEVQPASSELAAAEEVSAEIARDSIEAADESQEEAKPDEMIVVSDDDSHE